MDSASSIMIYILPITAVSQFLAALSISYYRTKYQKQDDKIYEIQLRPTSSANNVESNEHGQSNDFIRANTNRYNKIQKPNNKSHYKKMCAGISQSVR